MKQFNIPTTYRSSFISQIKDSRKIQDPRKKDFTPTLLDFGEIQFLIARHFGFCYGVENAIEIAYRAIEENPNKRIFLLSEMIHNPSVNANLLSLNIRFIMDTQGKQLIDWSELNAEDVVLIPAFGTTLEIEQKLKEIGIKIEEYNTTCPFVIKVWNQSQKLGEKDYTVIIHGKQQHEETRATFSHSAKYANSIVVRNIEEAKILGDYMLGKSDEATFYHHFKDKITTDFDPKQHLQKVGVVNQTTMLATETQEIANYFKKVMGYKFGNSEITNYFADTRDTLCYATNENQRATYGLLNEEADLAIVVGGYNSSNTSHLVELCEEKLKTYFIQSAEEIISPNQIQHYDFRKKKLLTTNDFLPNKRPLKIILSSGASCSDILVDEVVDKLLSYFNPSKTKEEVLEGFYSD